MSDSLDLRLTVPPGWARHENAGGPDEYRPRADGATGLLQVSRLAADGASIATAHPDLGALAAALGVGLGGRGQSWGRALAHREGVCALGRYGFAMFEGGAFPAMFLWVAVAPPDAFLWTWLGPSPVAPEVAEAARVVLEASRR